MLAETYKKQVIPAMMKEFGFKNSMAVPKIRKIVLNVGFGKEVAKANKESVRRIESLVSPDLATITGQKAVFTKSHKSIAGFKIREGMVLGAKVTLRKKRMWDFLERLVFIALPRTRDFRGIDPKCIDKNGNINLGIKEHVVFPEIIQEKEKQVFGLEITIDTTAKNAKECEELLRHIGFPLKKDK